MNLPRKVVEAEARANQLMEQVYGSSEVKTDGPQGRVVAPEKDGKIQNSQQFETLPEVKPEAKPSEQSEEPKTVQADSQPVKNDEDTWEHRYKVLSGKYGKEVPRYAAELREKEAKLAAYEAELKKLKEAPAKKKESLVKPEEVEQYGEEFLDVVKRAAREIVAEKDDEIEMLRSELNVIKENTSKSIEVDFYGQLADKVNDWVAINEDPNFHRWLAEPDELTGIERQQLLQDAEQKRDAKRAINFFNAWKKQATQRVADSNRSLESQVVPASASGDSPPESKRMWRRSEIDQFYAAVRQGRISDAEASRLEADIDAAMHEGRIL